MVSLVSSPVPTSALLRRIGRETIPALIPSDDLGALRTSRTVSGYLNVYASRHVWVAKVKEGGRLMAIPGSRQPMPHQAAAFVVAWYRARFGDSWKVALANRKRPYWQVKYSRRYGGWILRIWANGVATEARRAGADGRPTLQPHVFPLRSVAINYAKRELPQQRRTWAAWRASSARGG